MSKVRYVILLNIKIQAGFPSPADDYVINKLDLNKYLIKHPSATFFVRANSNAMNKSGIYEGNILVVDRSIAPTNNKIVIAVVEGEFVLRRLKINIDEKYLTADDIRYSKLMLNNQSHYIWGVVTATIQQF